MKPGPKPTRTLQEVKGSQYFFALRNKLEKESKQLTKFKIPNCNDIEFDPQTAITARARKLWDYYYSFLHLAGLRDPGLSNELTEYVINCTKLEKLHLLCESAFAVNDLTLALRLSKEQRELQKSNSEIGSKLGLTLDGRIKYSLHKEHIDNTNANKEAEMFAKEE